MLTYRYLNKIYVRLMPTVEQFSKVSWNRAVSYSFSKPSDLERMSKDRDSIENIIPDMQRPHASDGGIYSVEQTLQR